MVPPLEVLTILGTRPEVIKLFPVLQAMTRSSVFNSTVVCTAQHREMVDDLLHLFSIEVDHDLDIMQDNQSLLDICERAISGLESFLKTYRPDLVLVQGDTTTAFIAALAAFYNRIPVGHVEAGLRSYDKMHPYPEEINRRLISIVSDLHFVPTVKNAENLYKEGINTANVFVTGNTVIDSLLYVSRQEAGVLDEYLPPEVLDCNRMILITAHRRENWGEPLENLCYALKDLVESYEDIAIVYPVHPNPNVKSIAYKILSDVHRVHLLDPLPYAPFVEAMSKAHFIITDSGGIQEEGPSLQKPILVFRKVTERPEGVATGGVKIIGLERRNVVQEASLLLDNEVAYQDMTVNSNPYGDGRAAERIVQAIMYYFFRVERPKDFLAPTSESA